MLVEFVCTDCHASKEEIVRNNQPSYLLCECGGTMTVDPIANMGCKSRWFFCDEVKGLRLTEK